MGTARTWGGVWAAMAAISAGCLDSNPKFVEPPLPTASDSASDSVSGTTAASPTSGSLPPTSTTVNATTEDDDEDTEDTEQPATTSMTTATTSSGTTQVTDTTMMAGECGNGIPEAGEMCDDGNPDADDGCVACVVPKTCMEILGHAPNASSGVYRIVTDGPDPKPSLPVFCDMTTAGGGWTLVERSPRLQPIAQPLFADVPVNLDAPTSTPFRLSKATIEQLLPHSADMRIDCGGQDYLLTDAGSIFAGAQNGAVCGNFGKVLYKEARLKGFLLENKELCTGFVGAQNGCEGAWHIDEGSQSICGLEDYPWLFMMPVAINSADTFAVDPMVYDESPENHDCHFNDSVRVVMLR